jgi:hypothetical protein
MKKRFTQSKNEWSDTREDQYKSDSLSIAFELGFELIERDTKVYKLEQDSETLICEPDKPKSLWYETWLKLRKLQE